jgi:hypothetical protein
VSISGLPDDVERFIAEHVFSVDQLDVLLLLQRTKPREWNARQVAAELRTNAPSAAMKLDDLTRRDLLVRNDGVEPTYAYGPKDEEMDHVVVALRKAYAERHIAVIHLIFSKPTEEFEAMQSSADAFRIRKL